MSKIISNDYHDFVIKNGEFVGDFEEMYVQCEDPWPESIDEIKRSPFSKMTIDFIKENRVKKVLSVGGGKGKYLSYLQENTPGCEMTMIEISKSACDICRKTYPNINVIEGDCIEKLKEVNFDVDLIIFREILWYVLPDLEKIYQSLREKFLGAFVIIELSFYKEQKYGNEYMNGINDFLKKYPFKLIDLLLRNDALSLNFGYLFTLGRIENDRK